MRHAIIMATSERRGTNGRGFDVPRFGRESRVPPQSLLRTGLTSRFAAGEVSTDFDFPSRYTGAYQDRRRECAVALYDSVGIERGDRGASAVQTAKNFELFGAPHAAIVTTEADLGVYGAVDCGLYCQTFLLAAQSFGLGAIPRRHWRHRPRSCANSSGCRTTGSSFTASPSAGRSPPLR